MKKRELPKLEFIFVGDSDKKKIREFEMRILDEIMMENMEEEEDKEEGV